MRKYEFYECRKGSNNFSNISIRQLQRIRRYRPAETALDSTVGSSGRRHKITHKCIQGLSRLLSRRDGYRETESELYGIRTAATGSLVALVNKRLFVVSRPGVVTLSPTTLHRTFLSSFSPSQHDPSSPPASEIRRKVVMSLNGSDTTIYVKFVRAGFKRV